MKTVIDTTRLREQALLALAFLLAHCAAAQSSPLPLITDFDNTSLPPGYSIGDTTFCKEQVITIHGQDFKKATGGETWDTTWVVIGIIGTAALSITSQMGGADDRIVCRIPAFYQNDTCLQVSVIKKTVLGTNNYYYTAYDTLCVTGDRATVTYGTNIFCLGDPNPVPSIALTPTTATGGFCCRSGVPGFWINPTTGEIPLHPGAVGNANQFKFVTGHPRCPDTVAFNVSIRARQQAYVRINGQAHIAVCEGSGPVMADTATLVPPLAGIFRSPTGLYLLNPQIGLFDPGQSPVGLHELWWVPMLPCYDSAMVSVEILPTTSAVVGYPSVPLNLGVLTLCQGAPVVWPSFFSGNAGGSYFSSPVGLDLGPSGEIHPATSMTGTYTIQYIISAQCPDTIAAITNLHIDTTLAAAFALPQTAWCVADSLSPVPASGSGVWEVFTAGGQVVHTQPALPIVIAGTALASPNTYQLRHSVGGFCTDTFALPFTVLGTDDPTFSYPPNGNYCIGDPDPWPLANGNAGTFHAVTPATVVDLDGRLHLTASGAGAHTVWHVTGGTCRDSSDVTVHVFGSASANFAYPASAFCSGDTNPLPVILGTPGGVFSGDSGIVVNPSTGGIGLDLSLPGVWNVTYTLMGSCQAQFTQTVQISPTDSSTTIAYLPDHHCQLGQDPIPLILGDTLGSFVAGGGIVFSNTDKGQLDLSAMHAGGPYIVYYDIDNRCAIDTRDSVWIDTPDDPAFAFPQYSYCEGGANPLPSSIALPGGTFTEVTGSVIFTNATTGEIDASLSLPGGPYFIQYTTAGPCPETSTRQLTLLPKPQGAVLRVDPDTVYCEGQPVSLSVQDGIAPHVHWLYSGDSVPTRPNDPLLFTGGLLTGLDTVAVVVGSLQGCTDTLTVRLRAVPSPQLTARLLSSETNPHGTATILVGLETDMPATLVEWWALGNGVDIVADTFGMVPPFDPGTEAEVQLVGSLQGGYDLGTVRFIARPEAGSCNGMSQVVVVTLGPDTLPIFVPEVFTPDGNGQNDTWMITCLDGTDPEDYRMYLFNSAGGKVLQMDGLRQDFDGGSLPDGVYWWVLEVKSEK